VEARFDGCCSSFNAILQLKINFLLALVATKDAKRQSMQINKLNLKKLM